MFNIGYRKKPKIEPLFGVPEGFPPSGTVVPLSCVCCDNDKARVSVLGIMVCTGCGVMREGASIKGWHPVCT